MRWSCSGTQVGPLSNPRQLEKMEKLVADAVQHGAKVRTGGTRIDGPGYFYAPADVGGADRPDRHLERIAL